MQTFIKKKSPLFIILLLLLFYGINNYIWLRFNQFPPNTDQAGHLLSNLRYLDILTKPSWNILSRLLKVDNFYPPFFPFCAAIVNIVFGHSAVISTMTNMIFAAILFISVYAIGLKYMNKSVGLFAVFIVSMYPYVFGLSRMFFLEFALTAVVCFCFCCLFHADNFQHRGYSILFGLAFGVGMLTKSTFIFFLIGPLIITIGNIFFNRSSKDKLKKVLINLGMAFIISCIIGGSWYVSKLYDVVHKHCEYIRSPFFGPLNMPKSIIYYLNVLVLDQVAPFFIFVFMAGLVLLLKDKEKLKFLFVLLLWIVTPFIIFILLNVRFMYYTVPNLPAVALISSAGILKIQRRQLKIFLVSAIVIVAIIQYYVISYTTPSSVKIRVSVPTSIEIRPSFLSEDVSFRFSSPCHIFPIGDSFYHFPRRGDWKLNDIIRIIEKNNSNHKSLSIGVTDALIKGKRVSWLNQDSNELVTSWHDNFLIANKAAVEYAVRVRKLPYTVISLINTEEYWTSYPILDFIISVKKIEEIAPKVARYYECILQNTLPDGSLLYVYKKYELHA